MDTFCTGSSLFCSFSILKVFTSSSAEAQCLIPQVTTGKDKEHFKAMMENVWIAKAVCFRPGFKTLSRYFSLILDLFFERERQIYCKSQWLNKTLQRSSPSSLPLIGWRFCALSSFVLNSCRRTLC